MSGERTGKNENVAISQILHPRVMEELPWLVNPEGGNSARLICILGSVDKAVLICVTR